MFSLKSARMKLREESFFSKSPTTSPMPPLLLYDYPICPIRAQTWRKLMIGGFLTRTADDVAYL